MSRLRWTLGGLLVGLSLLAAATALRTYLVHKLWLGGMAVLVLAVIAVAGFASLARARLRLSRELDGLQHEPPSGLLFSERRQQLESLHARGARPDLDALAQATAAVELGQAYLGKYLVAVTVLVGLVGTFAGLMETLRGVAPLLADEQITTLNALAGPLAGLDVTFGASLVGILVTLALALVQGDLALAEEATLSRLEERTRHVLLPSLWPATESADERSVRELAALRGELTQFIQRTAEATSERVARVAQTEVDRLVKALHDSLTGTVQSTAGRVEQGLLSLAGVVEAKLGPVLAEQKDQLLSLQQSAERAAVAATEAGTQTATQLRLAATEALSGLQESTRALKQAQAQLLGDAAAAQDRLSHATQTASDRLHDALRTLAAQQGEQVHELLSAHRRDLEQAQHSRDALVQHSEHALSVLRESQASHATQLQTQQQQVVAQIEQALLHSQQAQATHAGQILAQQQQVVAQIEQALLHSQQAQATHAGQILAQQQQVVAQIEQALLHSQQAQATHAGQLQQAHAAQLAQLHDDHAGRMSRLHHALAEQLVQLQQAQATQTAQLQAAQATATQHLQATHTEHAAQLEAQHRQVAAQLEGTLRSLHEVHAARLTQLTESLCQTLGQTVGSEGARLGEAAQALQAAAGELASAAAAVGAPLSALTPELQALSREVALMAARSDGEESSATLSELLRLGEGVERLEALLRMSHGVAEHLAPAAAPGEVSDGDDDPGQAA